MLTSNYIYIWAINMVYFNEIDQSIPLEIMPYTFFLFCLVPSEDLWMHELNIYLLAYRLKFYYMSNFQIFDYKEKNKTATTDSGG